jgi:hypothetical protein
MGSFSKGGVFLADDFRDNLIIDRYDPCFLAMREKKKEHLRSENSEDAVSWNVFRSLRQISPAVWVPVMAEKSFTGTQLNQVQDTSVELWSEVAPPPELLAGGDEGLSEIDVILVNPEWMWFIEAKYKSDISTGTTTRPERDQVLRNIDVGSYYAGERTFYFSLLVLSRTQSPKGVQSVEKYRDPAVLREHLPHRADRGPNVAGLGILTWADMAAVLEAARVKGREYEAAFASRALEWLAGRGIRPEGT